MQTGKIFIIFTFISFFFLVSCQQEEKKTSSKNVATEKSVISSAGMTSSTSGSTTASVASTFSEIEFSISKNGEHKVCFKPSGYCRTNDDEHSGGQAAYELLSASTQFSKIHRMSFNFYSNGYFAQPDGHIAFGLRGRRYKKEEYGEKAGVDGRGIIIGKIGLGYFYNKNNPACVHNMAQVESYYASALHAKTSQYGNMIEPTTCSDTIFEDYKWYRIDIEVTSDKKILYQVFDANSNLLYATKYDDSSSPVPTGLTEWFAGHVFSVQNVDYSFKFTNFTVETDNGESLVEKTLNTLGKGMYFSSKFGVANRETASNYSLKFNSDEDTRIKVHNIFGRKRIFSCASFKATLNSTQSVDCSLAENYKEINFSTGVSSNSDWIFSNNSLAISEAFVRSLPTNFYSIHFRPNPMDKVNHKVLTLHYTNKNPAVTSGSFCDSNTRTLTSYRCGAGKPDQTWLDVGGGCYHKASSTACIP